MKVGAVIVDDNHIVVGMGYNGFPPGVQDYPGRYEDRAQKLPLVVHAEPNAVLNATKSVKGCTIYCSGTFNCNECAKIIIQAGIKRVVCEFGERPKRWEISYAIADMMFMEAGVTQDWINMDEGDK